MGPLRRSVTTSVLLVAVLLLGDGASAAVLADASGGHGLDRGVHGHGAWLVAAGTTEWWRGLVERKDPQGARQLLPLGTLATLVMLAAVGAWLAPGTRPRRALRTRARAPAGPRSPPYLRLA